MRFRQHQGAAQTRTVQLMLWFGVLVVALRAGVRQRPLPPAEDL